MKISRSKFKQHFEFIKENYYKMPLLEIADKTGLSPKYIESQASIYKITKTKPIINTDELIKDYKSKQSTIHQLESKYHTTRSNIKRILVEAGVVYRDRSLAHQTKSIDDGYFEKIDSEGKAYFFGFILADGNVYNNALKIELGKKDEEILKKFLIDIKSSHIIYAYKENKSIIIRNKKLVNDLSKLGCFPRKTSKLPFPTSDIIPDSLMRHFIRGYFDGDGWVTRGFHKRNGHTWCLGMMAPENFILKLQEIMNNISSVSWKYHQDSRIGIDMKTLKAQSSVGMVGAQTIKNVYDYFYYDATIFLERKKKIFEEIMDESSKHMKIIYRVQIGDNVFNSGREAADFLGIKPSTFRLRLRTNPTKYGYTIIP